LWPPADIFASGAREEPILSGFSLKKSQTWQSSLCKEAKNVLKAV
jgi:hypothetical protein